MTRADGERVIGAGHGYVSRLLRGERGWPELPFAIKFRDILGVPVDSWVEPAKGPVPAVPRVVYDLRPRPAWAAPFLRTKGRWPTFAGSAFGEAFCKQPRG